MVAWGYSDGRTSVPADTQTRAERQAAHAIFDRIWQTGVMSRTQAYRKLSQFLNKKKRITHIAQFNYEECGKTIEFAKTILG